MTSAIYDKVFYDYQLSGTYRKSPFTVFSLANETGKGEMAGYEVLPGISIVYNDLKMDTCYQQVAPKPGFFSVNHCLKGCYEVELKGGYTSFLSEGDLCISDLAKLEAVGSRIPTGAYKGITVLFEIETAQHSIDRYFGNSGIDIAALCRRCCQGGQLLLLRARPEIEDIFNQLYSVDERIRKTYTQLKIVELLLYCSLVQHCDPAPRFSSEVSVQVKKAHSYICEDPSRKLTAAKLSKMFCISETNLRECFKSIYGIPLGAFLRGERMKLASSLLKGRMDLSVGEISQLAGYENQSKFSAAFKSTMGYNPLVFRRMSAGDEMELKLAVSE